MTEDFANDIRIPAAFNVHGQREPSVGFDYSLIDNHGQHVDDPKALAADAFKQILLFCFTKRGDFLTAWNRFLIIATAIDPKLVGVENNTQLAKVLKCSKANVCKILRGFSEQFDIHLRQRSDTGIANMRRARLAQRDASGHVMGRRGKRGPKLK